MRHSIYRTNSVVKKYPAILCLYIYKVNEAVMNAILQDKVQVLCEWNMIDWVLTKNNDEKLMIESVIIEKEGERRKLICDALFNFYERTINLNAFRGNFHS